MPSSKNDSQTLRLHNLEAVVSSERMQKLIAMAQRVARGNAAVLITGETGSGKELIARAIHHYSNRASKAWIDVNCAALPEHLVESELFGYEKGAFSGADSAKQGMFELADKGTLFLDEIGELDIRVQVKLLRVLDGAPYYRLGGSRKVTVDVRLVTATNRPLEEAVRSGAFRSDLFHRIGEIQLHVPPLRERPDDVVALANFFLNKSHPGVRLSEQAVDILRGYHWPGNIRELRNVLTHSATMADGDELRASDLPLEIARARSVPSRQPEPEAIVSETSDLDDIERQTILNTLQKVGGHQGLAAEELGISRRTLSRKLKRYKVESTNPVATEPLGKLSDSEKQYYRARLGVPAQIFVKDEELSAEVINVSGGGVALQGIEEPFRLAGGFRVRFALPGTNETIEAEGQLVWLEPNGRVGARFVDLNSIMQVSLTRWIAKTQMDEGWHLGTTDSR
jgi:transcriptional regulator with PAS, ATPase and Fis domain